ncbi:hypothetical protein [Photorhabdus sp. RM71S]|uniref:hypothetical protein n=1 Tax=Photorhabdus sp. RM71S TaxID=3342824 RepID=UPI0036DCD103
MKKLEAIDAVVELLRRGKFDYADEKVCQSQMESLFIKTGVVFEKEYAFENGTVDFFFPRSGIVLEVKARKHWNKMRVYRQK